MRILAIGTLFSVLTILAWKPLSSFVADPEALRLWILDTGLWGVLVFSLLNAAQVVFAVIPGGPFEIAAGYVFGVLPGTLLCDVTMTLASVLVYLLVRKFGMRFVELFIHQIHVVFLQTDFVRFDLADQDSVFVQMGDDLLRADGVIHADISAFVLLHAGVFAAEQRLCPAHISGLQSRIGTAAGVQFGSCHFLDHLSAPDNAVVGGDLLQLTQDVRGNDNGALMACIIRLSHTLELGKQPAFSINAPTRTRTPASV